MAPPSASRPTATAPATSSRPETAIEPATRTNPLHRSSPATVRSPLTMRVPRPVTVPVMGGAEGQGIRHRPGIRIGDWLRRPRRRDQMLRFHELLSSGIPPIHSGGGQGRPDRWQAQKGRTTREGRPYRPGSRPAAPRARRPHPCRSIPRPGCPVPRSARRFPTERCLRKRTRQLPERAVERAPADRRFFAPNPHGPARRRPRRRASGSLEPDPTAEAGVDCTTTVPPSIS